MSPARPRPGSRPWAQSIRVLRSVVAAIVLATTAAGCSASNPEAVEAEGVRCPEGSDCFDPVEPIGPGGALTVEMFEFDYEYVSGAAVDGPVEVTAVNVGNTVHNFRIDEAVGDVQKVEAPAGEESVGTLLLFAGTYTFYCDIPGHREAGMEGTITVFQEGEVPDDPSTAFTTVSSQAG